VSPARRLLCTTTRRAGSGRGCRGLIVGHRRALA
jgi:hypothetical protein